MKVEIESDTVPFAQLSSGDTFIYGRAFLKMDPIESGDCDSEITYNAVCLTDGSPACFDNYHQVKPIQLKLVRE